MLGIDAEGNANCFEIEMSNTWLPALRPEISPPTKINAKLGEPEKAAGSRWPMGT